MSSIYHTLAKVLDNRKVGASFYLLVLQDSAIARNAKPGQFVHMRIGASCDPLLRRPFSLHWVEGDSFEILYQVVGRGTGLLSQVRRGEALDLLGPLGRGFDLKGVRSPLVVAGGLGIAPLLFLTQKFSGERPTVLIGGSTKEEILCEERVRALGAEVRIATEDGSSGTKGLVADLLATTLSSHRSVFACGPTGMLKEVAEICQRKGVSSQLSLEGRMGCGVGACLGCGVKSKAGGYKRVCSDGPVFHSSEIVL